MHCYISLSRVRPGGGPEAIRHATHRPSDACVELYDLSPFSLSCPFRYHDHLVATAEPVSVRTQRHDGSVPTVPQTLHRCSAGLSSVSCHAATRRCLQTNMHCQEGLGIPPERWTISCAVSEVRHDVPTSCCKPRHAPAYAKCAQTRLSSVSAPQQSGPVRTIVPHVARLKA